VKEGVREKVVWWLLLIMACTQFCLAYFQDCQPFFDLSEYMRGGSHLPYQYRVLMAWILRGGLHFSFLRSFGSHLPVPYRDPRTLIMFLTSWVSLFGAVLFTWRSLIYLTSDERYSRWFALLVIYMAYFHFPLVYGLNFFLPYDLPSLFFFSGCLFGVISRRMIIFYPFFLVGSFNRETICMATLFLILWRFHDGKNRNDLLATGGHVVTQAVIFVAVKLYLHQLFAGNGTDTSDPTLYYKLAYNLRTIAEPLQWPVLSSIFGFTVPIIFVWRKWMRNKAMERGVYVLLLWFVVMMFVGVITEIRIFSELISYATLAVSLIFYNRFPGLRTQSAPSRSPA